MTETAARRPKERSPAYPAINLETAIMRSRQLHEKERHYATPVTTIAKLWGYKSLNGPAAQTIAALKKYGLMEDEGSGEQRRAKVTELALNIIGHPDPGLRQASVREAALRPAINRELWTEYGNELPSDSSLRWYLIHDRGFTETGASEFLPVYRATIAFARLADEAEAGTPDESADSNSREDEPPAPASKAHLQGQSRDAGSSDVARYPIPLIGGGSITVEGPFPVSERDWTQFMAVLGVMKAGLVLAARPSEEEE
jgi:hypothetical protein